MMQTKRSSHRSTQPRKLGKKSGESRRKCICQNCSSVVSLEKNLRLQCTSRAIRRLVKEFARTHSACRSCMPDVASMAERQKEWSALRWTLHLVGTRPPQPLVLFLEAHRHLNQVHCLPQTQPQPQTHKWLSAASTRFYWTLVRQQPLGSSHLPLALPRNV
jgi:hypothetical protein